MNKIDWRYLRQAIIIFTLSLIIAVLIGLAAERFRLAEVDKYQQSLAELRATYRSYNNLVNDIDLLEQYRTLYDDYKSSGLVGDERRLSWIESLERTNNQVRLPKMTYRLMPQEDFVRPGLKPKKGVILSSAPMSLSMELLHEEDILSVFDGLRDAIENLFTVDSCSLARSGLLGGTLNTQRANLTATCVIRWVTIDAK